MNVMNVHSDVFVPRFSGPYFPDYPTWTPLTIQNDFYYLAPGAYGPDSFDWAQQTYLPLPLDTSDAGSVAGVENDVAWTPVWSDVFEAAEQERQQRDFATHQENERTRQWWNTKVCSERKLIHVEPVRESWCDVQELEKQARLYIARAPHPR